MLDSPPPAEPVKRLEPLCTLAMRLPILLALAGRAFVHISIRKSNCPSEEWRGV